MGLAPTQARDPDFAPGGVLPSRARSLCFGVAGEGG